MSVRHPEAKRTSSPRTVIRGESPLPVSLDYLSFSVPGGNVDAIVRECVAFLGAQYVEDRERGLYGYRSSLDIGGYCKVAYGGKAQRGSVLVSIPGEGCRRIADFRRVRSWAESLGARITRVDIAADDQKSAAVDVCSAIQAWRDGEFTNAGRPPKARIVDDFESGEGRTLYVGARTSGKMCRVYEKGKQLGDRLSKWVRAEVELLGKDRVIPWEAVTDPVTYLAGTYPFFGFLSLVAERIRTIKRATEISIEAVTSWVRLAAGKSLNVLLEHFDGDYAGLVCALRRDGVPKRLQGWWGVEQRLAAHGVS
jgi:phage replication initiation protein